MLKTIQHKPGDFRPDWQPHTLLVTPDEQYANELIQKIEATSANKTTHSLHAAVTEIHKRYTKMQKEKVTKYQQIENSTGSLTVIVRADRGLLPSKETATKKQLRRHSLIKTIARLGRSVNISLIITCNIQQQIDNPVIYGELYANISKIVIAGPATIESIKHLMPDLPNITRNIKTNEIIVNIKDSPNPPEILTIK